MNFSFQNESFVSKTIYILKQRKMTEIKEVNFLFKNSRQTNCHTKYIYIYADGEIDKFHFFGGLQNTIEHRSASLSAS